eukprot:gene22851-30025_t
MAATGRPFELRWQLRRKIGSAVTKPGGTDPVGPSPPGQGHEEGTPSPDGKVTSPNGAHASVASSHGRGTGPSLGGNQDRGAAYQASSSGQNETGTQTVGGDVDCAWERRPTMPYTWKKGDSLGQGSFGTVYLGLNNQTGELLAVKEVSMIDDGPQSKEAVGQLEQEVALLSQLNHANIVRYIGTKREGASLFIFLEYVAGGSISSLITRFGPLEEDVIRVYTRQLLSGLAYLHAQRTVHRDVKGANLLVEKDGRIKLADFGMAKQMVEQASYTRSFKGSAFWMAPEVIKQQGHGIAADIWSIGCTVLEMATGKPPWCTQCTTQVQAIFKIASSQDLPSIPESLSPEASEFVMLCLQRDPAARPAAQDLLQHPFVNFSREHGASIPGLAADPQYSQGLSLHQLSSRTHTDTSGSGASSGSFGHWANGGETSPSGTARLQPQQMNHPRGQMSRMGMPEKVSNESDDLAQLVLGSAGNVAKHRTARSSDGTAGSSSLS